MNANMNRRFVFCLGAMLFAGTLAAQTPVPEWQAGVDKVDVYKRQHVVGLNILRRLSDSRLRN